jgi:cyclopropane fatty-acyl-phospholipid synthase-like methyltransferase
MTEKIPERFFWALGLLEVQPSDRLLEIGCGHGVLLSLVAEKLTGGKITAIDRSAKMVAAAASRAHLASGKAEIIETDLAGANLRSEKFDKIFAFNVNVFWMEPRRELAAVKRLLAPEGTFYLFFDPPSPGQAEPTAAKLKANLEIGGFRILSVTIADVGTAKAVCVIAAAN